MVSTLIETININADDFTDNFLTCPTCMGHYDNSEHTPKLLPCSHTLCRICLERIAATATQYTNHNLTLSNGSHTLPHSIATASADAAVSTLNPSLLIANTFQSQSSLTSLASHTDNLCFRCPICRETIVLPRGGVNSFPPSFIVNQLIDLVGRQRRDLVPRCTNHPQEELLFCETCDSVFCSLCENHCRVQQNSDHIVIPFSIAIKRMSEILLFKSNQCVNSFSLALANVNREIEKLDETVEQVADQVHKSFNELKAIIDKRRDETLANLCKIRDHKTKLLREQMLLISQEKQLVQQECKHYENKVVDVRFLTQNIASLNQKLDYLRSLCEPRENSFIMYECKSSDCSQLIKKELKTYGKFKISSTYPPLCNATFDAQSSAHIKTTIRVQTVDYHGNKRIDGGDPLTASIIDSSGKTLSASCIEIIDQLDGNYFVKFTPLYSGQYRIELSIFDRPLGNSPYKLDVSEHINSIWSLSGKGTNDVSFNMPVSVCHHNDLIYVLDSGNNRLKVLDKNGTFIRHIENIGFDEGGCTSICLSYDKSFILGVNWRLKMFSKLWLNYSNETKIENISIDGLLEEPIAIVETFEVEKFLVFDSKKLHVCNSSGQILVENLDEKMKKLNILKNISAFCCSTDSNNPKVYVADSTTSIYEFDFSWLCDKSSKLSNQNSYYKFTQASFSSSTLSLISNNSIGSGSSSSLNTKGSYTALHYDRHTKRLIASKCDKQKTVVDVYNLDTRMYEFSIDSHSDKLKRVTSLCTTPDGLLLCVDLLQNSVKMFRYV